MNEIIKELNELEVKVKVYSDNWGSDSIEVQQLDEKIRELNLKLLDFMVEKP